MPKSGQKVVPSTETGDSSRSEVADSESPSSNQAPQIAPSNVSKLLREIASKSLSSEGPKTSSPPMSKPSLFSRLSATVQNNEKDRVIHESRDNLLASQFDQLNQLWDKAEKQLNALHVPHDIHVTFDSHPYGDEDGIEGYKADCITWQKYGNFWRICWGEAVKPADENAYWQVRPISDCPIKDRVEAATRLPALIEAIRKARNNYIPKVIDACEQIRTALKSLHVE